MSIHSEHPFLEPESRRDPVRRLRGRLGGTVSLWTSGSGVHRAGLTVSSLMVAPGEPGRVLGLVDPDSDLALAVEETGTAVVQLLSWEHRDLADVFAGVAPAPGGAFRSATWDDTRWGPVLAGVSAWAGIRVADRGAPVGWSVLLDGVVEHVEIPIPDSAGRGRAGPAGAPARPVRPACLSGTAVLGSLRAAARRPVRRGGDDVAESEPITVMVVDDHPMWRENVARDLAEAGFAVTATASTGTEALTRAAAVRPRVVVLDLQIPAPGGVQVTVGLVRDDPTVRVLILSASGEQSDVLEAVKAGATGYLVKSASREELVAAVGRVAAGEAVFTPGLAGLVLGEYRRLSEAPDSSAAADTPRLTERETEVLRLVAKGMSYKLIAERLFLSHRTVQNHVQNTLRKLQLHNRVQLVRYAIEQGLDSEG